MIACLGWGSLIWDPRILPVTRYWFNDGPFIRVEYLRQSKNNRITLVLHEESSFVRSLWSLMNVGDLKEAKSALALRENTKISRIGSWSRGDKDPEDIRELGSWAEARGIDNVIWTALPPKFDGKNDKVPSLDDVINHLAGLIGPEREHAEMYIRRTPKQIDTEYRRQIESALGWTAQ